MIIFGPKSLPCNLRMYPDQEGRAISPDLSGPVAVMDKNNEVISIVNVSVLLAADQHKHPHDAIFLPNGDMVVATWAPGRISYWKKLPTYKIAAATTAVDATEPDVCSPCYEKPPACTGSETSVQITGVTGDFCSPLCYQNQCPKGDGSFTATPSCVLETQGSSKPTQCALICTPGDDAACPAGASCQSIQGEGICTYPSRRERWRERERERERERVQRTKTFE